MTKVDFEILREAPEQAKDTAVLSPITGAVAACFVPPLAFLGFGHKAEYVELYGEVCQGLPKLGHEARKVVIGPKAQHVPPGELEHAFSTDCGVGVRDPGKEATKLPTVVTGLLVADRDKASIEPCLCRIGWKLVCECCGRVCVVFVLEHIVIDQATDLWWQHEEARAWLVALVIPATTEKQLPTLRRAAGTCSPTLRTCFGSLCVFDGSERKSFALVWESAL